ncbi:phage integrase central domain-containing protein, partial [Lactiplantibacillus pentosus]
SSSKAAKLAFDRAKVEFDQRKNNPAAIMDNPTFDEVYEVWLKTYKLGVKESTLNRVEGIFKHHIMPSFGGMRINTITWQKCQEEALKWRESVKQFNKLSQYAALVFRTAQKMGVITTNPMKLVDVPKVP